MISLKHGFLFIHIPKTAGNSIQNILKYYSEEKIVCVAPHQDGVERFQIRSDVYEIHKHSTLLEYQNQLGQEVINQLFKFTCVRNPWERMISFYFSGHRQVLHWNRAEFVELVNDVKPVIDFVTLDRDCEKGQKLFESMDYYIRFEQLNKGFENVCARIGIPPVKLPRHNTSNHDHYSTYYDDELVELIREIFQKEINYWGFRFEKATA